MLGPAMSNHSLEEVVKHGGEPGTRSGEGSGSLLEHLRKSGFAGRGRDQHGQAPDSDEGSGGEPPAPAAAFG